MSWWCSLYAQSLLIKIYVKFSLFNRVCCCCIHLTFSFLSTSHRERIYLLTCVMNANLLITKCLFLLSNHVSQGDFIEASPNGNSTTPTKRISRVCRFLSPLYGRLKITCREFLHLDLPPTIFKLSIATESDGKQLKRVEREKRWENCFVFGFVLTNRSKRLEGQPCRSLLSIVWKTQCDELPNTNRRWLMFIAYLPWSFLEGLKIKICKYFAILKNLTALSGFSDEVITSIITQSFENVIPA